MSDKEKVENHTFDDEDAHLNDTKKEMAETNESISLNESQDFHLIDVGDTDDMSLDDSECTSQNSKLRQDKSGISESVDTDSGILSSSTKDAIVRASFSDTKSSEKSCVDEDENSIEKHEPAANDSISIADKKDTSNDDDPKNKKNVSDEEDDIIQPTPPQNYVSPKTSFNTDAMKLKRKATSFEESVHKIQRTTSHEDALIFDKRKCEQEDDKPYESDDSAKEFSHEKPVKTNVIIEETQEVMEDECSRDVGNTAEDFEIADSQNNHDETDKNSVCKDDDVNQNNNPDKAIEAKVVSVDSIDKQESQMDTKSTTNNAVSSTDVKENDEICDTTTANVQSNTNSSETVKVSDIVNTAEPETHCKNSDDGHIAESVQIINDDLKDTEKNVENTENSLQEIVSDKELQKDSESVENKEMPQEITSSKKVENDCSVRKSSSNSNLCNSRKSIEVIYDRVSQNKKSKPKELIEIDEVGEKIVLDSSQEDSQSKINEKSMLDTTNAETVYKSCYDTKSSSDFSYKSVENKESASSKSDSQKSVSSESKRHDTDETVSVESGTFFNDIHTGPTIPDIDTPVSVHSIDKQTKQITSMSKTNESTELLSVSDNDPDSCVMDDVKNKSGTDMLSKTFQMEREIGFFVKLKCLLQLDENTKEFLSKELMAVQCEPISENPIIRQKTEDTSASLADISGNDNKDTSPGSVNSNPQVFPLNPSRLSFVSTISSSSSASSAASLAAKLALKANTHFSLPRGPAKHAKKFSQETYLSGEKQTVDDTFERLTKEWKNNRLLTATILNHANAELNSIDPCNISNERLDDQLQKICSSTPEIKEDIGLNSTTPKSTRKGKSLKRPRSKASRSSKQLSEISKASPNVLPIPDNASSSRKKTKLDKGDTGVLAKTTADALHNLPQDFETDKLVGKKVFAKWSDNNYYPGKVTEKVKTKYKVNFYDGKNKVLIEDFIIPIPHVLSKGLSVYATTKNEDYGSCGIIIENQIVDDEIHYVVETDEGERLKVQVKDIFLSSDQAHVLKEESNSETKSLPTTPKSISNVTLDNMVDGKRRSKRIGTPLYSTPKTRASSTNNKSINVAEPSSSGTSSKPTKETLVSDSEGKSSDSGMLIKDETLINGTQAEIYGTPNEQIVKGPRSRIKGKMRNKRKSDDEETIATLGPIPEANSKLFEGMSFILAYASTEDIDRYLDNAMDNKSSNSDTGTESEEIWVQKPFVRDRLKMQIVEGGGKIYDDFNSIPKDEYKNVKLITNVPNRTEKHLWCLSVGIPAYNHNWIIRCCQQNKIINPAEEQLPAGWSLEKHAYIDMFLRKTNKPLTEIMVIIPIMQSDTKSSSFWRQICENAGAVVLLVDNAGMMDGFSEGTVVLTDHKCPSWAVEKANALQIPLLSTMWVTQCLIEGRLCPYDKHPRYRYNCVSV